MSSETHGVIADRYAAALFSLAVAQDVLDAVASDLKNLKAMIGDSADLRRLLGSPVLSRADQGKGIAAVAQAAGLQPLTSNFLGLLAKNRRLSALPGVVESFLAQLAAQRGELAATVASAVPLSDQQRAALESQLKAAFGQDVAVEMAVDPSLLGGLVVKVGSRMVDSSIKTKLQHLKLAMKGIG